MTLIVAATKRIESRAIPPSLPGPAGTQHVMPEDASAALCEATGLYTFPHLPYSPTMPNNQSWCQICREKADALYDT